MAVDGLQAAAAVAFLAALVLVRMYARRRLVAGSTWAAWPVFGMPVVLGALLAWIGLTSVARSPVGGVFLVLLGTAWVYMGWRLVRSTSRSIASATTPIGRADTLWTPVADFTVAWFAMAVLSTVVMAALLVTGLWR